ncbi:uncharacterized protein PG986_000135 [Apiospora aurea]|uniref:Rhodopsin domain-containing protein n=1 Tax=Apiospora aurea TaxID=335848 RepID=A0ABR1QT87_9PEZI
MGSNSTLTGSAPNATEGTIPELAFYALAWVFFDTCTIALSVRMYIRYACFYRLLVDDGLMVVALLIQCITAVLFQLYIHDVYKIQDAGNGEIFNSNAEYLKDISMGSIANGVCILLMIVGIAVVKLTFLLFFRRLGAKVSWFNAMWWAVLLFTMAALATQIGIIEHYYRIPLIRGATLVLSLPVAVLWRSRICIRQKLILTFVFCLTFVTIAITIVRGNFSQMRFDSDKATTQSPTSTAVCFWYYCEFTADRRREKQHQNAHHDAIRNWRARMNRFHTSLLDTCRDLDGWHNIDTEPIPGTRQLPDVPPGLMTVDFNDDANWKKTTPAKPSGSGLSEDRFGSVHSSTPTEV